MRAHHKPVNPELSPLTPSFYNPPKAPTSFGLSGTSGKILLDINAP